MAHTARTRSKALWSRLTGWWSRRLLVALCVAGLSTASTGCAGGDQFSSTTSATTALTVTVAPTTTAAPASWDLYGTFAGEIDTGARAAEGVITLQVDEDGIGEVGVTLTQVVCDGLTVGGADWDLYWAFDEDTFPWAIQVSEAGEFNGAIAAVGYSAEGETCVPPYGPQEPEDFEGFYAGWNAMTDYRLDVSHETFPVVTSFTDVGRLEGRFSSEQAAEGTITIFIRLICTDRACELGTFRWSAVMQ